MNLVRLKGAAKKRPWLLPPFSNMKEYLQSAFTIAKKANFNIITEGFPLCFLNGFKVHSIEAYRIAKNFANWNKGYIKAKICKKCSLKKLCPGIRIDYFSIHKTDGIKPSRKRISNIIKKLPLH
ncbi:MAG: hypothetical protein K6357_02480 [Elusimicrobiota bacterium]